MEFLSSIHRISINQSVLVQTQILPMGYFFLSLQSSSKVSKDFTQLNRLLFSD